MLLMLILIGVSSCSNEDENIGNIPSQLIKTWYMGEGTYITFNADGTGVYTETDEISTAKLMRRTGTRATDTYSFTYSYEESTQTLTIHIDGDVMRWTIVTLTDDTLKIKDEEGELITLKKNATSEPDIDITLLYNTWISETQDIYTFNNDGNGTYKAKEETSANDITYEYDEANKLFTLHEVEEMEPYTVPFKYDAYNRIYFFENESWSGGFWQVKQVTQDILSIDVFSSDGENLTKESSMTLFRIPEPDELVVGDESLLYGDEWTSFDLDDGTPMVCQFRQNFSDVIWTEDGESMTFNYTYNTDSHKLTLTEGGETVVFTITKLTDRIMYLESIDEDGEIQYMEFRKL